MGIRDSLGARRIQNHLRAAPRVIEGVGKARERINAGHQRLHVDASAIEIVSTRVPPIPIHCGELPKLTWNVADVPLDARSRSCHAVG